MTIKKTTVLMTAVLAVATVLACMSNKMIIIIPKEFHKDFEKVLGKLMKFHGEEIMD
jgi:hypothetical protein